MHTAERTNWKAMKIFAFVREIKEENGMNNKKSAMYLVRALIYATVCVCVPG